MNLQPNLPHKDTDGTIEQPYQLSVNRVFEPLTANNKATISKYEHDMDHRDIFVNMEENNSEKAYALHRKLFIQKENYDLRLTGAALCINTDLKIFWHLLNRKKIKDEMSIFDFCEEMKLANPRNKNTHKMVIESFYRLSNNIMTIAAESYSATFQLISYKKENEMIKYSFNEDFLKLVNSKNGLERHNINTLNDLNYGISKQLYTMLVKNKYKKDGSRSFTIDELKEELGIKITKKGKIKERIKESLEELKLHCIISDYYMKLDDVIIYNRHNKLKTIETIEEEKKVSEVKNEDIKPKIKANVKKSYTKEELDEIMKNGDINNINDCFQYGI